MKPIKISNRLTLVEVDGIAGVETKADLHPAEVFSAVENWILNNQNHPRRGDVESWLDLYEQYTPRPRKAKPLSEEMLQKISWSERTIKYYRKHLNMSEDLAKKIIVHVVPELKSVLNDTPDE